MKILLTGASGFLGAILKTNLSFDNRITSLARTNADFKIDLVNNTPKFDESFDLVIHAAGIAHVAPTTKNEIEAFYNVNVGGTKNLLNGLVNTLPNFFVYISSVSVYGLIEGENINEQHSLNAKDPYGKSKIEAEKVVQKWCEENNVVCTIFRLPLVVASNPPGNLGAMINGIKKGYYFNIAGGNAKKSMVLASDIAKYILIAAKVGGIYNLTDGIHPTFNKLSHLIANDLDNLFVPNIPLFLARVLAKFGDILGNEFPINSNKLSKITSTLTFDDSYARKIFGWNPTSVLE